MVSEDIPATPWSLQITDRYHRPVRHQPRSGLCNRQVNSNVHQSLISQLTRTSNTHFHDHYKASLVGHDDGNGAEDTGYLHVTYANNLWTNIESRMPLLRFGTAHIYNSYFEGGESAVNTRMGAQALVESSVFDGVKDAVTSRFSKEDGYAIMSDVDLGSASDKYPAPEGTLTSVPYEYELVGSGNVKSALEGVVGNTLTLG